MPVSIDNVDLGSEVAMAWCTSEERGDPRFNLNTRFPGLAALMIAKLSVYPSDSAILDESTSRDYQRNSIWHYSSYCGPALALSAFLLNRLMYRSGLRQGELGGIR